MLIKLLHEAYAKTPAGQAHQSDWWRSSSLGSCRRGTFLRRLFSGTFEVQNDARTMMVFELGNIIEDFVIKKLHLLDPEEWLIVQQGEIYDPVFNLKGHFDLLLINKKTKKGALFEIKSKNSRAFTYMDNKKEGAQQTHKFQLKSYIDTISTYGFSLDGNTPTETFDWIVDNLPCKKKKGAVTDWLFGVELEYASILYVSKDDQRLLEYPIGISDNSLTQEWLDEVILLNHHWNNRTAPPLNDPKTWAGNGKYCDFCQQKMCQELTDERVKELFTLLGK